jgi:aryl-alcohol dehydrogenase-like predicted oxidoreductase
VTPLEETVAAFDELVSAGVDLQPRPATQPTVVHRFGAVTDEVLHYLEHHSDMALWAYTPLLSGRYTRADKPILAEYDHSGTTRRLAALDEIAGETGTNRNRVVLAWLTGAHPAATPIVGVSTVEQLDEAIAGVALELTPTQRERLNAAM